jgi:HK97 family phage portal protein
MKMRINPFKRKSFTARPLSTTQIMDETGNPAAVAVSLYEELFASNSVIYQTQPNVRTVVDFIARNVAQVNIKLFDRLSDTERVELSDHPLTALLNKPNPDTTRYRMIYGTVADLAIYDACFWIKQRSQNGKLALVRVPPEYITVYGSLTPKLYRLWFPGGDEQFFSPDQIVHFHGYHPTKLNSGVSPMETLRNIIAEDVAAGLNRRSFWKRGARMEGIIMRPGTAPELSIEGKKRFLEEWEATFAGSGNAGRTGLLEEDMGSLGRRYRG